MYCLRHKTGEIRLLHKKNGLYVIQDLWVDENLVSKDGQYKFWWEDRKTIEENELVEDTNEYITIEEYTHQGMKKVIDNVGENGITTYHWEKV